MKDQESFFDIETEEGLTMVRFRWPGNRAASGLWVIDQLERFFERQRKNPSKVVVFLVPPDAVRAANLELCDTVEDGVGNQELKNRMKRRVNTMRRLITAIRQAEPLVVAVVDGIVALRAVAPLLACDFRIAAEDATFRYESKGHPVAPAGGVLWFLNRLVGPARTAEIVSDERRFSAREAQSLGLVNFVVSAEAAEEEALDHARRIASVPKETLLQLKYGLVNADVEIEEFLEGESRLLTQVTSSMLRSRAE